MNGEQEAKERGGNRKSGENLARSHTRSAGWLQSVLSTLPPVLLPSRRSSFPFFLRTLQHAGPLLIAPLIKEYLEFIGLYLFTECACQESGVPLKFTVTRSFTRQQPISRHPDQTIRWARRTSIPPWVIVGVLPTRPPMTCSVSRGQSFREVQKSRRITRQRERVLTWTLIPPQRQTSTNNVVRKKKELGESSPVELKVLLMSEWELRSNVAS